MNFDCFHIRVTFNSQEEVSVDVYAQPDTSPYYNQYDLNEYGRIAMKEFNKFYTENCFDYCSWNEKTTKLFEKHCRNILYVRRTDYAEFGVKRIRI